MFWGHLNKKQRVKQCRPSEVFKLNDWCIQFHEFNSLKETTQYLVWDKEGEEDTEDHVMNQLFQAADTSDDKNNDRGKSRGRSRDRQRQRKRNSPNEREERSLRLPQSLTVRVPRALRQAAVQASLMIPSPRRLVGLSVSLL